MRFTKTALLMAAAALASATQLAYAQRGGARGGAQRGGFGGGVSTNHYGGSSRGTSATGPYGGGSRESTSRSYDGSEGGQYKSGTTSGSYTTQRGGTVDYGAAGEGAKGPGGTTAGRGVYGVSGTTAGGRSYSDYGRVGGAAGPEGNAVAGRSNVGAVSGPYGTAAGGSREGGAYGAEGYRGGAPAGYGAYGANRYGYGAAAVAPAGYGAGGYGYGAGGYGYGTAAPGYSGGAMGAPGGFPQAPGYNGPSIPIPGSNAPVGTAPGYNPTPPASGTYYAPASALADHGAAVRDSYAGSSVMTPGWYLSNPTAGKPPVAAAAAPLSSWGAVAAHCGYPQQPSYNTYGGNVVSQPGGVYVNGNDVGTPQQYAQQASAIAGAGAQPNANSAWAPLGVYAMAESGEANPVHLFQLAINKQGQLRGNYHNTESGKTTPISGSVDSQSQRAAWTIGQNKTPVFEAGIANLTQDQTTMMVHDQSGQSRQATLVRLPPPEANADAGGTPAPAQ
jgi:hypothetical protein